jgi:transposase
MKHLESLQNTLESFTTNLASPYQPQIDLLMTVPGIGCQFTAIRILAEIGIDMSVFETSKQLCSWAGLAPQNNESANKKKTTRIARAGAFLKPLLVQCTLSAVSSNKYPWLKDKYQALKKRRGHKKAVIAIARKLLAAIWNMLAKNQPYNHELHQKSDPPPINRMITAEQGLALLRKHGFQIIDTVV